MKRDRMTRMIAATIAVLLLCGTMAAQSSSQGSGQSLGDAARAARQKKAQSEPAARHYDNDNLPTSESISVVGPEPSATASDQKASTEQTASTDSKKSDSNAAQRQAADDAQKKVEDQQAKIDALAHELDLDQREYRLRAAAFYSDAGSRLRDASQWDKDDARYKSELEAKQKTLDEAKAQLTDLQEAARKAGVKEKDKDSEKDSDKENKDTGKDK